jgi:signal recognition particle subunit SRP68
MEVQSQANDNDKFFNKQETTHTTPLKIDILILTTSMQNQNGIRQNDYYRYSRFCNKKIQKLRQFFKLTQGKKKFNKIEITPENVVDSKVLLIPILESERKWAKGMHYKQQITIAGKDIKRLRYNITKKFKKAALQSKKIFDLCKLVADTQTTLEAEAYSSLIEANYLIFKRNFNLALNLLKKTANIYEKISQLKDTIESITYKEKINLIKTQIRLCLYNLSVRNYYLLIFSRLLKTLYSMKKNCKI